MVVWGIIAIVAGRVLKLCVERRRFYRRNAMGVEQFPNFGSVVITRTVEKLAVLSSRILFIGGLGVIFFCWTPASSWQFISTALEQSPWTTKHQANEHRDAAAAIGRGSVNHQRSTEPRRQRSREPAGSLGGARHHDR